jgi:hypothetical protein
MSRLTRSNDTQLRTVFMSDAAPMHASGLLKGL